MSAGAKCGDGVEEEACTVMETSMVEEEESFFNPPTSSETGVSEAKSKHRLENLCRVCANTSDYFIPIFENEGIEHQLDMKIHQYLPIQLVDADGLPTHLCLQCASTLIAWHDLVTACVEADKRLHLLLQQEVNDGDYDDHEEKEIEFYDEPLVQSDEGEELSEPSTSAAVVSGKESLLPQKRTAGKGKQQRKAHENISSDSNAKRVAVPVASKEAATCLNEATAESAPAERWHLTQYGPFRQPKYEADSDAYCDIPQWIKTEGGVDLTKINTYGAVIEAPDRPIFECDHCGKILSTRENMKIHLRIHTGERPFACHICGKCFQAPSGFKRHVKEVHDGIKNKLCDICNRAFANKRTLEDHRRIHTGERPFVCAMCGKMFKTKASLYIHNRSHSDVFPFPCTQCDNQFRTQATLSLHILRHTGEKPHVCEMCGRGFRVKYELGRHKLVHSENKPFSCGICGHTFRQKKYLANHNRTHHNETYSSIVYPQGLNI